MNGGLKNYSQSHYYCVNQNGNEKQRLKNKLEKLKYYCYGREQYNSLQVNRYIYIYIGTLEKEEERSPTESGVTTL